MPRLRNKTALVAVCVLGLAGCGGEVNPRQAEFEPGPMVNVLVTTMSVEPGCLLNAQNSEFRRVPASNLPDDNFFTADEEGELEDRAVKHKLQAGDIVVAADLGRVGDTGSPQFMPAGMRVVSFKMPRNVLPLVDFRDRVDVILTNDGHGSVVTECCSRLYELRGVEFFASDTVGMSQEHAAAVNVTVLVTVDQAHEFLEHKDEARKSGQPHSWRIEPADDSEGEPDDSPWWQRIF